MDINKLKVGDKVTVQVEGTIQGIGTGHGICFFVELPQKDFSKYRRVWINGDEIVTEDKITYEIKFVGTPAEWKAFSEKLDQIKLNEL